MRLHPRLRLLARHAMALLPRGARHAAYRSMVRCDRPPPDKLVVKLAETRDELEACFRLLHDAYVGAGFMQPDRSGLRVTLYHALPTTSTLLAKHGERVVGTLSLIRESALGFPLQRIFDIQAIRQVGGRIAEVSALAIDPRFRSAGGTILFPLLKFMYEYSTRCFDTRHLVIAVNPRHIALYESLLLFERLRQSPVAHYDFVNGAPAVGAHLDLESAPEAFRRVYDHLEPSRNLYRYFTQLTIPNIRFPDRRFYTTSDPVMTPALIDYFFNQRTQLFARLGGRERILLHSIYDLPEYKAHLPPVPPETERRDMRPRRHKRFSVRCPGAFLAAGRTYRIEVLECSMTGFRAHCDTSVPLDAVGEVCLDLGRSEHSELRARVRRHSRQDMLTAMFEIEAPDAAWRKFVSALHRAQTHEQLEAATQFL